MTADSGHRTPDDRVREALLRPDAQLLRDHSLAEEVVSRYSTAIHGGLEVGLLGSGVFLSIGSCRFVLTAGHVAAEVHSANRAVRAKIAQAGLVVAKRGSTVFLFRRHALRFQPGTGIDYAFFELQPEDAGRLTAYDRIAAPLSRLLVSEPDGLDDDDYFVLSGYPGAHYQQSNGDRYSLAHTTYVTALARHRNIPTNPVGAADGVRFVDVSADPNEFIIDGCGDDFTFKKMDPMPGVSGGGCWKAQLMPRPELWKPEDMRLVAIHIGRVSAETDHPEKRTYEFGREILVGHHLRLIAETCPETRGEIYGRWPWLETWPMHDAA